MISEIKIWLSSTLISLLFFSCISSIHSQGQLRLRYASYKQTPEGCATSRGIILGLEFDWEITNLHFQKDSLCGNVEYFSERINTATGKLIKAPYERMLYIYKVDTLNCKVEFLDSLNTDGTFKIKAKKDRIFTFAYYTTDVEANLKYQRCIVVENK